MLFRLPNAVIDNSLVGINLEQTALHITPETEARLLAKAREQEVSVDALLQTLINESESGPIAGSRHIPDLPLWHLGTRGPIHRRDIYDEAA